MATRSIVAVPDNQYLFRGRYVHGDGYPDGVGAELAKIVQRDGVSEAIRVLISENHGWSIIRADQEPGPTPLGVGVAGYGVAYTDGGNFFHNGQSSGIDWAYVLTDQGIAVWRHGDTAWAVHATDLTSQATSAMSNPRAGNTPLGRPRQETQQTTTGESSTGMDAQQDNGIANRARSAEASETRGIYVYSFPHYLRYPTEPRSGRTRLGVAFAGSDAYYGAAYLGSLSVLPEPPVLLRIYPTEDESRDMEKRFKDELGAADHHVQASAHRAGREWFVTSLDFLDRIARDQGLEVRVTDEFGSVEPD